MARMPSECVRDLYFVHNTCPFAHMVFHTWSRCVYICATHTLVRWKITHTHCSRMNTYRSTLSDSVGIYIKPTARRPNQPRIRFSRVSTQQAATTAYDQRGATTAFGSSNEPENNSHKSNPTSPTSAVAPIKRSLRDPKATAAAENQQTEAYFPFKLFC